MKWKTTLVLLALTIGFGAYVALYELKQPPPEERGQAANQLVDIEPDDVTGLLITLPAVSISLQRRDTAWELVSPLSCRADSSLAQRILSQLDPLQATRILRASQSTPLPLPDYGLEPPQATLTVSAGSQSTVLLFGERSAVGESRYVKRADRPEIGVINAELFDLLNQPVEQYRSHALLAVDPWRADQIQITHGQTTMTAVKQPAEPESDEPAAWRLTEPVTDEADRSALSTLLSKLRGLRIDRFLHDSPSSEQRTAWGLDAPSARIRLTAGNPPTTHELQVGAPLPDQPSLVPVSWSTEPPVYAVAQSQLEAVLQEPNTLRSRACFDFFTTQVSAIQVSWQGQSWRIERREGAWVSPEHPSLDGSKVEAWVASLRDVQLLRILSAQAEDLPRFGLEPPQGTIEVWLTARPDPVQLFIGGPIEPGTTRYGRVLPRNVVGELPHVINDLMSTPLSSFNAETPAPPSEEQ